MDSSGVMRVVGMVAVEAVVLLGGVYLYNKRNQGQSVSNHGNTISTQTEDEEITSEDFTIEEDTTEQLCNDQPDSGLRNFPDSIETSTREDENDNLRNGDNKTGHHGNQDDDDGVGNMNDEVDSAKDGASGDAMVTENPVKMQENLKDEAPTMRSDNSNNDSTIDEELNITQEKIVVFSVEPYQERAIGRSYNCVLVAEQSGSSTCSDHETGSVGEEGNCFEEGKENNRAHRSNSEAKSDQELGDTDPDEQKQPVGDDRDESCVDETNSCETEQFGLAREEDRSTDIEDESTPEKLSCEEFENLEYIPDKSCHGDSLPDDVGEDRGSAEQEDSWQYLDVKDGLEELMEKTEMSMTSEGIDQGISGVSVQCGESDFPDGGGGSETPVSEVETRNFESEKGSEFVEKNSSKDGIFDPAVNGNDRDVDTGKKTNLEDDDDDDDRNTDEMLEGFDVEQMDVESFSSEEILNEISNSLNSQPFLDDVNLSPDVTMTTEDEMQENRAAAMETDLKSDGSGKTIEDASGALGHKDESRYRVNSSEIPSIQSEHLQSSMASERDDSQPTVMPPTKSEVPDKPGITAGHTTSTTSADSQPSDIVKYTQQGAIPKQRATPQYAQGEPRDDTPVNSSEKVKSQKVLFPSTTESVPKKQDVMKIQNLNSSKRNDNSEGKQANPPRNPTTEESQVSNKKQFKDFTANTWDDDTASDISACSSEGSRMTRSIQASPSVSSDVEYFGKLCEAIARSDKKASLQLMKYVDLTRQQDGFTLLHMAAKHGVSVVVSGLYVYGAFNQLLEVRAGRETGRFQGLTARDIAEKCRHVEIVQQIDKFYECEYYLNSLHQAARSGKVEMLRKLCENQMNVNAVGNHGNTPLYMAACAGRLSAIQLLLKYGADVSVVCDREKTVLHKAAEWGHYDVVRYFVSQCHVDVNVRSKDGITPLHLAAAYSGTDIVAFLLDHNASINYRSHYNETPLYWAVAHGNIDVVQLLVQKGARSELQTSAGLQDWNYLHIAASSGHIDMCLYLMDHGYDLRSVTQKEMEMNGHYAKGVTALHLAAGHGHQNLVKFLTENGVDVNTRDASQCTPLHYASQFGHQNAVQQLLYDRADVNAQDQHLLLPVHKTAMNGHAEVTDILVQKGARLDLPASAKHAGCLPLHLAAAKGHYDVVLLLLKRAAAVNATDNNKQTALHFAAKNGHLDVVRLLFSSGASLNCKDQKGDTPLTLSLKKNHWEVSKFLKGIGAIGRTPIRQKLTRFSFGSPRS